MLIDLWGIGEIMSQPVRTLSLGQRGRAELALALLHRPKILLLDEASIGFDFQAKNTFQSALRKMSHDNQTSILMTTNNLDEILHIADFGVILNNGKIILDGAISELNKASRKIVKLNIGIKYEKIDSVLKQIQQNKVLRLLQHKHQRWKIDD